MLTSLKHSIDPYLNMYAIQSTDRTTDASRAKNDMLLVVVGVCLAYSASLIFNLSERLNTWLTKYEYVQLDELPLTILAIALLSLWFSHRRIQEIKAEIALRTLVETQLRNSQQLYKTLFEGDLTGNVVMDLAGRIRVHNGAFERIFHTVNGQACHLFHFDWQPFVHELKTKQALNYTKMRVRRVDGLPCFVSARFIYVAPQGDEQAHIHAYLVDMTEQCLVELDLARTLNENRVLARHAIQLQEQERKYIASEIHDETGQYLSAIRMDALALQKGNAQQMPIIAVRIASNISHVQQSVRALIKHLRPPALDALGLMGATERLIMDWRKLHPTVSCELKRSLDESRLHEQINLVAYRVIQEALTNVARHAEATQVNILLKTTQDPVSSLAMLHIEISDDGRGMPATTEPTEGVGLIGMRERVESMHGKFSVHSMPGQGTHIRCQMPLNSLGTPPTSTQSGVLHAYS